jgi:peptide-methionine (R)-S-oxide reductase
MKEINPTLTEEEKKVLFEKGTEAPGTGAYLHTKDKGMYTCKNCGHELFSSDAKFDSGTGWPSFDNPVNTENVVLTEDGTHGMSRTEVTCKNCGAHLGHVFDDGPTGTGKRYCINSACLDLKKAEVSHS